jgi:transcriptional regulator with XRE-family HTH domain
MTITADQVKAARKLLGWSQSELAGQSGVSATTIGYAEADDPRRPPTKLQAIRAALESAGVEFIAENGGGAGVRLRKGK